MKASMGAKKERMIATRPFSISGLNMIRIRRMISGLILAKLNKDPEIDDQIIPGQIYQIDLEEVRVKLL